MKKHVIRVLAVALLAVIRLSALLRRRGPTPGPFAWSSPRAASSSGVGGGEGVLVFRGHSYPFTVSGMSVGFTIGASTTQLSGHALNLRSPGRHRGKLQRRSAPAARSRQVPAACSLQNNKTGVVLQLAGGKVGVELSAAVGGVTITLR